MEQNRTIIIVDDEPETVKGYVQFLTPAEQNAVRKSSRRAFGTGPTAAPGTAGAPTADESYRLLLAHSGEEALKIVEKEMKEGRRIAAGFFDVKLEGGMDGLATIHAIKSMDPDIHCVVVTAYHDRSVEEINNIFGEQFKDQWDYLNKPFTQGEIVQKARQMTAAWNRKRMIEAMNAQLVQTERLAAIGQVARGVGHEFGNILLRIIGKADMALVSKDVAKIHDHVKVIMTAAERAAVIVKNLQSFGKTEPFFQPAVITAALDEALTLMSHELVKFNVTVEKDIKETPQLQIDVGGLAQVFLNLFINAAHAMPNGGKIKVTVETAAGPEGKPGVVAKVADSGTGIPADVLPKIFDFAFTTKGARGSGIGLSVSKQIVESHHGALTVQTEVGKGTEFSIWVPMRGSA